MLRRLVSLLLIPFFVLGSAIPHSHAGSGAPVSSDHSARPHVHVGSHDHGSHGHAHGHEHDEPRIPLDAPAGDHDVEGRPADCPLDHDADAVYLLDSGECIPPSAPVERDRDEPLLTFLPHPSDGPSTPVRRPAFGHSFLAHNGLPIFLFVAALRL